MPPPQPAAPAGPAAPLLAAPSAAATGTETSRRLLHPESLARPLTLWGSSSMRSEGGDEATALPVRIHEHLALSAAPAAVHAFGVGATRSPHTLLMRGLDTPALEVLAAPEPGSARIPVALDSGLEPHGPLRVPGTAGGVTGMLDGSSGDWFFVPSGPEGSGGADGEAGVATADEADGAAAVATADEADGAAGVATAADADAIAGASFTSALAEIAQGSRQVLWMGKNNIRDIERVLEDTRRMSGAAAPGDTLVLGHWCTERDPQGSASGTAVATVNTALAEEHGDHFLDVQELLTGEEGLSCSPLVPLQLLDQGTTQDALGRAVAPPLLVAADGIHLNGWGNLAVSWAIVRRMRELQWL